MNDKQAMHAMSIDDAYRVERVLARGAGGVTELVSIDGAGPFVRKKMPAELARRRVWSALAECSCSRLPHLEATYELPDQFVVVYDFVAGESLERHVERHGRLDIDAASRTIRDVCEAAEELHRHGIVHRDISPANIIVSADGAHLIDLGIARMRVEGAVRDTTSLGTWGFASPEQYGFAQTDARSDVYSIGRLLGYLLTGVRPDDSAYDGLLSDGATVPPRVRRVIERACAFEPSARYQSARELANELRVATQAAGTPASQAAPQAQATAREQPEPVTKRKRLAIAAVAAGALVIVLGIGGYFALANSATGGTADNQAPTASDTQPERAVGQADEPDAQTGSAAADTNTDVSAQSVLELVETGWSADSSGYVHYGFGLKNTSDDTRVNLPAVDIVGRAKDGSILFSETQVLADSFAGQTSYFGGQVGNGEVPTDVEFKLAEPEDYNVQRDASAMAFALSNTSAHTDDIGNTVFTGEVTTQTDEALGLTGSDVAVSVILRDADGAIVYGDTTFVKRPGKGKTQTFEISIFDPPAFDSYDISAQV